jgi:hypothetical protein
MGERDPRAPLWSYRVNLDKRARSDHSLRRINEALDLSFVGGQVAHTYGRRGNKSVPPEVILRMMLLLFLDDIKSDRMSKLGSKSNIFARGGPRKAPPARRGDRSSPDLRKRLHLLGTRHFGRYPAKLVKC